VCIDKYNMTHPLQKNTWRVRDTRRTRAPRKKSQALSTKHTTKTGDNSQGLSQLSQSITQPLK
jgi:hypothetical protein